MTLILKLTPFQTVEVEHGMSIDADDGRPSWGELDYDRNKKTATLFVTDTVAALWRITSSRDIWSDNAATDPSYGSGARSLDKLVDKLVELAGGRDAVLTLPNTSRGEDASPLSGADLTSYI